MKLTTLLPAALLPLSVLAAPVSEEPAAEGLAARDALDVLAKRRDVQCGIYGDVNCRTGPGTGYKSVHVIPNGAIFTFTCVKSGECITVGGIVNCGWDYIPKVWGGCYVNGHYTGRECTQAALGWC
ncbi:hypothetical protein C8A01DRAFT_40762 [Parachaetomium inaequale]|uniref:Uncharacterized protein n=1 Tax=Parachaetomium inaequale TaxID=2588326 RepID=A0AAN6SMI2_9PEZI|nr:hypothetical protein C8A01DRAFT_40762 [Parachaetomium inaequale]